MPANSYTEWTEEDVRTLDVMYQNNLPLEQIAKALDRTPRAVEHALKNLLVQQVLHRNTHHVATKYNMTEDTLYHDLVPAKYYLEAPSSYSGVIWAAAGVIGLVILSTYC